MEHGVGKKCAGLGAFLVNATQMGALFVRIRGGYGTMEAMSAGGALNT